MTRRCGAHSCRDVEPGPSHESGCRMGYEPADGIGDGSSVRVDGKLRLGFPRLRHVLVAALGTGHVSGLVIARPSQRAAQRTAAAAVRSSELPRQARLASRPVSGLAAPFLCLYCRRTRWDEYGQPAGCEAFPTSCLISAAVLLAQYRHGSQEGWTDGGGGSLVDGEEWVVLLSRRCAWHTTDGRTALVPDIGRGSPVTLRSGAPQRCSGCRRTGADQRHIDVGWVGRARLGTVRR